MDSFSTQSPNKFQKTDTFHTPEYANNLFYPKVLNKYIEEGDERQYVAGNVLKFAYSKNYKYSGSLSTDEKPDKYIYVAILSNNVFGKYFMCPLILTQIYDLSDIKPNWINLGILPEFSRVNASVLDLKQLQFISIGKLMIMLANKSFYLISNSGGSGNSSILKIENKLLNEVFKELKTKCFKTKNIIKIVS